MGNARTWLWQPFRRSLRGMRLVWVRTGFGLYSGQFKRYFVACFISIALNGIL